MDERGLMAIIVTLHPGIAAASIAWASGLSAALAWFSARRGRRFPMWLRLALWLALATSTHASLTARAGLEFGDIEVVRMAGSP